jgi:hypothetical protein
MEMYRRTERVIRSEPEVHEVERKEVVHESVESGGLRSTSTQTLVSREPVVRDPVVSGAVQEEIVHQSVDTGHERAIRSVLFTAWSPAQFLSLAIGAFFLIIGGIALAKAGADQPLDHVNAVLHQTQALAYAHLGAGLAMVIAGLAPAVGRVMMLFLGAASAAAGIVVLVQHRSLHEELGTHPVHGVVYLLVGIALVLAGFLTPVVGDTEYVQRRSTTVS